MSTIGTNRQNLDSGTKKRAPTFRARQRHNSDFLRRKIASLTTEVKECHRLIEVDDFVSLPGLEENIGAVSIEVTAEELRDIDAAASKIKVEGARYPERLEKMTGL